MPGIAAAISISLFYIASARMLYPPDVGSEGKEVVDLEQESAQAIGLVIQRDQFPDRLFAPPKRETLMEDGTNPVYDKEMRSEIFGQGTLMLRLAIQISMLLAIPVMAWCFCTSCGTWHPGTSPMSCCLTFSLARCFPQAVSPANANDKRLTCC